MGFRRYLAPNTRDAMERIRKELGPEAVILSNRQAGADRVEIIAAAPGEMRALVDDLEPALVVTPPAKEAKAPGGRRPTRRAPAPESFQDFIRRQTTVPEPRIEGLAMYRDAAAAGEPRFEGAPFVAQAAQVPAAPPAVFRRRAAQLSGEAAEPARPRAPAALRAAPVGAPAARPVAAPEPAPAAPTLAQVLSPARTPASRASDLQALAQTEADMGIARAETVAGADIFARTIPPADTRMKAELEALRTNLGERIASLEARLSTQLPTAKAAVGAAQPALRRRAMTRLLMSGFSPELARRVGDAVPVNLEAAETDTWLQKVIAQQMRCASEADNPLLSPGAVALVGPTGVGKTTTMAKLAARTVVRHGAAALGLVNLDSYRMGAQEQLRSYGRILGVPVYTAHDATSLNALLVSLKGKSQILIDTCGVSQRDPRLAEILALLDEARFGEQPVQRVLLLNAASHAETLDEVARAWQIDRAGGVVLTKIDEAARIGGALDTVLRFRTALLGLTNGQRVPEDWHPVNPLLLAHIAMKPFGAAFCMESEEIQALSGQGAGAL